MHHASRRGDGWLPVLSGRERIYEERFRPRFREIAAALQAGRTAAAEEGLAALEALDPEYPFDLIASIHAGRLEDLTARRDPAASLRARRLFEGFSTALVEASKP